MALGTARVVHKINQCYLKPVTPKRIRVKGAADYGGMPEMCPSKDFGQLLRGLATAAFLEIDPSTRSLTDQRVAWADQAASYSADNLGLVSAAFPCPVTNVERRPNGRHTDLVRQANQKLNGIWAEAAKGEIPIVTDVHQTTRRRYGRDERLHMHRG